MRKLPRLLVLIPLLSFAQGPVKVDAVAYFSKIPPLPSSVQEAVNKAERDEEGNRTFQKMFRPLKDELLRLRNEISLGSNVGDLMKKAQDDPEAMEKMSEAEKMKMAEQMMKQMGSGAGPQGPEPPMIQSLMEKAGEMVQTLPSEITSAQNRWMNMVQNWSAKIDQIDTWKNGELRKIPHWNDEIGISNVTDAQRAAMYKRARPIFQKAINDRTAAFNNSALLALRGELDQLIHKFRNLSTPYNDALRKANYGAEAKGSAARQMLGDGQSQILTSVDFLAGFSSEIWVQALGVYDANLKDQETIQQQDDDIKKMKQ